MNFYLFRDVRRVSQVFDDKGSDKCLYLYHFKLKHYCDCWIIIIIDDTSLLDDNL